jgi:D-aminoacyl-tRNA deacylase
MRTVIVSSSTDPAGSNIHDKLVERQHFRKTSLEHDGFPIFSNEDVELITSRKEIVSADDLDSLYPECRYVFISRHRAESGIPSLTAHFTGNFGEAKFGGNPNEVARCSPSLLKSYFSNLVSRKNELQKYEMTLEATHHGPTSLKNSVLFVELGSTRDQWIDTEAASFVASVLMTAIEKMKTFPKCAIALGGTHYPAKFSKFLTESDMCLGHIVPKYSLPYVDELMLNQIIEKSEQPVKYAVVDSKGLGLEKKRVLDLLSQAGLEAIKL